MFGYTRKKIIKQNYKKLSKIALNNPEFTHRELIKWSEIKKIFKSDKLSNKKKIKK